MKLLLPSVLVLFLFSGCTLHNPFTPPTSTGTVYQEASTYPTEPIRTKAMYRATMKSYTVDGKRYYPIIPQVGQTFKGTASWYGPNFHGNKTSNGEYYDMHSSTAAHKTLPMNTTLQVTNLDNGASTIVRINDRGPFVNDRIIDLSHQAALDIGLIKKGTARVKLEVLDFDHTAIAYAQASKPKQIDVITPIEEHPSSTLSQGYKVQIVSTQNREKAQELADNYATIDVKYHANLKTKTFWQRTYYKVLIGDFETSDEAQNFIADHAFNGAFVVKD